MEDVSLEESHPTKVPATQDTWRPKLDEEIKIREYRGPSGEIEHVVSSTKSVSNARSLLLDQDECENQPDSSVAVRNGIMMLDEKPGDPNESRHVKTWIEMFDAEVHPPIHHIRAETIGRDFTGWTSMYDGSQIDKADMNEWLEGTVATILNGHQPGSVLEIGSGTGMVLFNLGDGLQSYVGIDPSRNAIQFVEKTAKSIPALAGKVYMYKGTAVDVDRLGQAVTVNLVVLNSVVQYFPSQEYLLKVIEGLLELKGVEIIFFGDIRSYALHREFLATRALHMANGKAKKADLRRMMNDLTLAELELLVDPGFFTALPSRLPGRIRHVEILPKKMKATNELSCYRYAAIVHVRTQGQEDIEIHSVGHDEWVDFVAQKLDRQSLLQHLQNTNSHSKIAVSNIPYDKSVFSRYLVDSLDRPGKDSMDDNLWLHSIRHKAKEYPSLSVLELIEIARNTNYSVAISWNRQHSQYGGLDAVLHRQGRKNGNKRVMFNFPSDHEERPLHSLSNDPLRPQLMQRIQSQQVKLEAMRKEDYEKIWVWNANVPLMVKRCLHRLIEEQAQARPSAPAIHAWDGDLTYSELDDLATRLAHRLVGMGIRPQEVVPLCFEKSMWTTVALLAVLKAGGAICMLEPTYPEV